MLNIKSVVQGENVNLKTICQQQERSSILRVEHKVGTHIRKERGIPHG